MKNLMFARTMGSVSHFLVVPKSSIGGKVTLERLEDDS